MLSSAGGSGGTTLRILCLGTRWRRIVTFSPRYFTPSTDRNEGPVVRNGRFGEEAIWACCRNLKPIPLLSPVIKFAVPCRLFLLYIITLCIIQPVTLSAVYHPAPWKLCLQWTCCSVPLVAYRSSSNTWSGSNRRVSGCAHMRILTGIREIKWRWWLWQ